MGGRRQGINQRKSHGLGRQLSNSQEIERAIREAISEVNAALTLSSTQLTTRPHAQDSLQDSVDRQFHSDTSVRNFFEPVDQPRQRQTPIVGPNPPLGPPSVEQRQIMAGVLLGLYPEPPISAPPIPGNGLASVNTSQTPAFPFVPSLPVHGLPEPTSQWPAGFGRVAQPFGVNTIEEPVPPVALDRPRIRSQTEHEGASVASQDLLKGGLDPAPLPSLYDHQRASSARTFERPPLHPITDWTRENVITGRHRRFIDVADSGPRPSVITFTGVDVLAFLNLGKPYVHKFKDYYVNTMREPIRRAAKIFDLPAELLAGTAHNEVGGDDPAKRSVLISRQVLDHRVEGERLGDIAARTRLRDLPLFEDLNVSPNKTSVPPMSVQIRRAAETLGYDPANLSRSEIEAIADTLQDPVIATYIAAAHLSELRDQDFPGVRGWELTDDQIRIIGARYNHGPDKSHADLRQDLSYGNIILRRWNELSLLLSDNVHVPRPNPLVELTKGNIVGPIRDSMSDLRDEIRASGQ